MFKSKKNDADKTLKILSYVATILRIIASVISIIKNLTDWWFLWGVPPSPLLY